jgi:formylglycine-generating enzyme required for sulfatase activity
VPGRFGKPPARYAVVIGVGKFVDPRIPSLSACANDAKAVYAALTDPQAGMFPRDHVSLLIDEQVTPEAVTDALDTLSKRVGPQDLAVVFFSGHGATDERGRAYWIMHGTQPDHLRATALPETDISDLLGDVKTTRMLTLIDACYAAATANVAQAKAILDLQAIYPKFQGEGRVAITASKGDQLSVVIGDKTDPGYGYSAFTWHLVQGLKGGADANGDGVVDLDELWNYVKDRTAQTSRRMGGEQLPQLKGQTGSQFLLTINFPRLQEMARQTQADVQQARRRLTSLKTFFTDDKLTAEQYSEGKTLLNADSRSLDPIATQRRKVYQDLTDGKLSADYVQAALDRIISQQRDEKLAKQAAENQAMERQQAISKLLTLAHSKATEGDASAALTALASVLDLDPQNIDAIKLKGEILERETRLAKEREQKAREAWASASHARQAPDETPAAPPVTRPASAEKEQRSFESKIGLKFVEIRPGTFLMGSPAEERGGGEETLHRVTLTRGFYMATTPVTQAQFWTVMDHRNPSGFTNGDPQEQTRRPVENVTWDDAVEFCRRMSMAEGRNYRLPTEAEWEYACRAGTQTPFWFGTDNASDHLWFNENSSRCTHPVGEKGANPWGLYDMDGNVFQWCSDWYGAYPAEDFTNPAGVSQGTARVLRGGAWCDDALMCRSARRYWDAPGHTANCIGFRLCADLPSE